MLFAWAVVSPASARLILAAFVSLHDRRALRKHYKKLADSDSWVSRGMTLWKRIKRLWTQLTTEEVFDERGSLGRRTMVRRSPRG